MENINTLLELIQANYPISKEAEIVFSQSYNSFVNSSNSMLNYSSQDPTLMPAFCAKFLHLLEKEGVTIHAHTKPGETFTFRTDPINFESYTEIVGVPIEPIILSSLVDEAVRSLSHNKSVALYTVIPYVDYTEKKGYVYVRGLNLTQKTPENVA